MAPSVAAINVLAGGLSVPSRRVHAVGRGAPVGRDVLEVVQGAHIAAVLTRRYLQDGVRDEADRPAQRSVRHRRRRRCVAGSQGKRPRPPSAPMPRATRPCWMARTMRVDRDRVRAPRWGRSRCRLGQPGGWRRSRAGAGGPDRSERRGPPQGAPRGSTVRRPVCIRGAKRDLRPRRPAPGAREVETCLSRRSIGRATALRPYISGSRRVSDRPYDPALSSEARHSGPGDERRHPS